MAIIDFDELVALGEESRSTVPLSERKAEVDQIAREYSAKPILVALMELLLTGDDVPIEKLRYVPEKYLKESGV